MPQIHAYLSFDGNCADAMRFYERVLGGNLKALLKNSDTPAAADVPPGNEDRIMHAYLEFDGGAIMAGDAMCSEKYDGIKGVSMTLSYDDTAAAKRVRSVVWMRRERMKPSLKSSVRSKESA